jgi:hypothetical protein
MKKPFVVLVAVLFASPTHAAGFFERLHNKLDEGVRELCAQKPDLCKKLEATQKRNANTASQSSIETVQINQRTRDK